MKLAVPQLCGYPEKWRGGVSLVLGWRQSSSPGRCALGQPWECAVGLSFNTPPLSGARGGKFMRLGSRVGTQSVPGKMRMEESWLCPLWYLRDSGSDHLYSLLCLNLSRSNSSGCLASSCRYNHIMWSQRWWLILSCESRDYLKFRAGKGWKRSHSLVTSHSVSSSPTPLLVTRLPPLIIWWL